MKRKVAIVATALTLCVSSLAGAFSDVSSDKWYYRELMELKTRGIVEGYGDNTFRPENKIRKGEALIMILRSVNKEIDKSDPFKWIDSAILVAADAGIIDPYKFDRTVVAREEAKRSDVVEMIVKAMGLGDKSPSANVFVDSSNKYANILYEKGILKGEFINGKPYFNPNRTMSRAEMGALTIRVLDYMEANPELPVVEDPLESTDYTDSKYFEFDKSTGTILFYRKDGPKNVVIPREIDGVSVTNIGQSAFVNCSLTSVVIPDSVKNIEALAFHLNKISRANIPDSVSSIGWGAFDNNKLTSIIIPDSVTIIGESAFSSNELTSVDIPDSVKSIGSGAFLSNKLASVFISKSITSIESSTFASNNLTSVDIPDSVKSIGSGAFRSNKLSIITIPKNVTSIAHEAFKYNEIRIAEIPKNTNVSSSAFDKYVYINRY